jgi:LPS-assembly protein
LLFTNPSNNFLAAGCESTTHFARTIIFSILLTASFTLNSIADAGADKQQSTTDPKESLCPAPTSAEIQYFRPRSFSAEEIDNTEISADHTQSSNDGSASLAGNVIIEKHLLHIEADNAYYDKKGDRLEVSGNVIIDTDTLSLHAGSGSVEMGPTDNQGRSQATFKDIQFIIPDSNMKGKAKTIATNQNKDNGNKQSTLKSATITSCSLIDPDWLISADEIWLDHDDEYGSADDVVIRFKSIPFLYTPYIEFPTSNKRRSGLLFPEFGTSSSRGAELAVPWYWNIAPNQDAVIEPRYMNKRGLELGGNYRFLTQSTTGVLGANYLHKDDITQQERYQLRYKQQTLITPRLLLDVNYLDISDSDYFNDFSNELGTTSQTYMNRNAALNYNLNDWQFRAVVQNIKAIDEDTPLNLRPYERLPQLTFFGDSEVGKSPVYFTFDSEYVDFTHEDDTKVTGARATIRPGLRLSLSGAAWFLEPAIKFSHTQYDVGTEGNAMQPGTNVPVGNLSLPISSIDTGLFFERKLDSGFIQTLEPRLYYLNVPFEDQSNTPLFDTSIPEFSTAQLFRDNRFIGGDRVGDANQLTVALTSRILDTSTGNEFMRATIGQIYYFEDRKVSIDNTVDTAQQSDVIAELGTAWGRWQSDIRLQWDTTNNELSQENYFLHYKSDDKHLFNIGYRKRLENRDIDIEQTDTSFVFALTREYTSFARWNYSLKDHKNIDIIAGLAYDSCCWSIQLLGQRRIKNTTAATIANDDNYDNSILVQFVFKGIGSLSGSKARTTLKQSIYGYTDVLR